VIGGRPRDFLSDGLLVTNHVDAAARDEIERRLALARSSPTAVGLPQPSEARSRRLRQFAALLGVVERVGRFRAVRLTLGAAGATAATAAITLVKLVY